MKDFFISCNPAEQELSEWIARVLQEAGYTVELQEEYPQPYGDSGSWLSKTVSESRRTIVVLSKAYLLNEYSHPGWENTFLCNPMAADGAMLTIRVEACQPTGVIDAFICVDLVGLPKEDHRRVLLHAVKQQSPSDPTSTLRESSALASGAASMAVGRDLVDSNVVTITNSNFYFRGTSQPQTASVRHHGADFLGLWNVPLDRNPCFTGREQLLIQLNKLLREGTKVALSGMPGVGKTQIAAEYVHRYREHYRAVFWLRAQTISELVAGFVDLALLLELPLRDEGNQAEVLAAVKRRLTREGSWLLVVDNVDDLEMVLPQLPNNPSGRVLLTTRATTTGLLRRVEVPALETENGALLLLRRAKIIEAQATLEDVRPEELCIAEEVSREVGGLPLALDQAGAYIEETRASLQKYLRRYRQDGARLRAISRKFAIGHASVTVAFDLAFMEIQRSSPTASELLRACAFLAPDAIAREIFTGAAQEWGDTLRDVADEEIFERAVEAASCFSLLHMDIRHRVLGVHRLVQDILKDGMSNDELRLWAERATRAVERVFPFVRPDNWPVCERLLPQAQAVKKLVEEWSLEFEVAANLLNKAGYYLRERGRYAEAESFYKLMLSVREKVLGVNHPRVASSINYLAGLYQIEGRHNEAEPLFCRALKIFEAAMETGKPALASINGLARLYKEQRQFDKAEKLLLRALEIRKKNSGEESSQAALSLYDLAELNKAWRRYRKAQQWYEQALAIQNELPQSEQSDLARTLDGLGWLFVSQNRYAKAEPLFVRALGVRERLSGPEHPDVATCVLGLASLYRRQGRLGEAEPLYQRALSIRENTFGSDHPKVADVLDGYAQLLHTMGHPIEAENLEVQAEKVRSYLT
ncbi:MAG: tetratricopeptide repeat protein [Aphanocapsa lilacina HA4352-LM1]|jgi:tetratricopeptide (TPR) repeat protein|nr:tetratricopeptide repeat protein [Aphanocapsa lilacina HA4352-LM1]